MTIDEKYDVLIGNLKEMGSLAVAFSGGVDSSFLLYAAKEALGNRVFAITAGSVFFPDHEYDEAASLCRSLGVRHMTLQEDVLSVPGIKNNPANRCYLCKKALFGRMLAMAREGGAAFLAEGSNMDDMGDYRPGMQAVAELGVRSPLKEAGLGKAEIRSLSKRFSLPTWNRPSKACLASRFAYGETLTEEKLKMVESAENYLDSLGFSQLRVRVHGSLARIEVPAEEIPGAAAMSGMLSKKLKEAGFSYVSLDLTGFRSGSMNEVIDTGKAAAAHAEGLPERRKNEQT